MKRKLKLVLLNAFIIVAAVVGYSGSLLGLRPWDPSILKAGFSILLGLGLASGLVFGNYKLLQDPSPIKPAKLESASQIESTLKSFTESKYFGDLAKTGVEQYSRLRQSAERARQAVEMKFQKGSMSAFRYTGAVNAAENAAVENMKTMALRMSVFSDAEYARLLNYKNDDIPDDIQEQQLALYDKSLSFIRRSIAVSETLILKLDTLAFEMSDAAAQSDEETGALLDEITALTNELKFYN
ncbi:MAG: hypothetical protein IJS90_02890 [Clostridia bacterium]|nr:hypothetical protein [Clostridia bacterium]